MLEIHSFGDFQLLQCFGIKLNERGGFLEAFGSLLLVKFEQHLSLPVQQMIKNNKQNVPKMPKRHLNKISVVQGNFKH